jgi:CheY-like chemotaxis protein
MRKRGEHEKGFDFNMLRPKSHGEKGVRVLVIEDSAEDRELLWRQLRQGGLDHHVKFMASGKDAWEFLAGPDAEALAGQLIAVFLDLKLPGMDGVELLRRLRNREEYAELPVIVMTSSTDPRDWEECQRLKVVDCVAKPVSFASFSKAVADAFRTTGFEELPLEELILPE